MPNRMTTPSDHPKDFTLSELREKILKDKAEYRNYLANAPIDEKLRILEEMRDFTAALEAVREENRMRMRPAWIHEGNTVIDEADFHFPGRLVIAPKHHLSSFFAWVTRMFS
jgi:hypothetical protein